jgi:hypothetical protein
LCVGLHDGLNWCYVKLMNNKNLAVTLGAVLVLGLVAFMALNERASGDGEAVSVATTSTENASVSNSIIPCNVQPLPDGTDNIRGIQLLKSPSGTHAVRYDAESKNGFQIVKLVGSADCEILADSPSGALSVICELACYPYAEWLSDSTLIVGTYAEVANPQKEFRITKVSESVYDLEAAAYRAPTQKERDSFDLYNDSNFWN